MLCIIMVMSGNIGHFYRGKQHSKGYVQENNCCLKYIHVENAKFCNTRSVNKVMRLIQYNSLFIFKLQIKFVPFKIVPLGGYIPPETLFPLYVASLEVANRNHFQLVGYSFFNVFHHPKMASFKVKLQFWEPKKVARTQIRGVWGL